MWMSCLFANTPSPLLLGQMVRIAPTHPNRGLRNVTLLIILFVPRPRDAESAFSLSTRPPPLSPTQGNLDIVTGLINFNANLEARNKVCNFSWCILTFEREREREKDSTGLETGCAYPRPALRDRCAKVLNARRVSRALVGRRTRNTRL